MLVSRCVFSKHVCGLNCGERQSVRRVKPKDACSAACCTSAGKRVCLCVSVGIWVCVCAGYLSAWS